MSSRHDQIKTPAALETHLEPAFYKSKLYPFTFEIRTADCPAQFSEIHGCIDVTRILGHLQFTVYQRATF
jgi:hypothetical protein